VPSWPHVSCAACPNHENWRDCFQETVVIREASGQGGDDGEYRRTYRCAACMGQEWGVSTREALFRIRDGRWDINKRRKQNAAFNQASATIALHAPALSRGERRNLAVDLMKEAIGPILRFILLKEKALAHRGELLKQHEDFMDRLRDARHLEDIQFWIPGLNKLEEAIDAISAPLAFRSRMAAQWDFIRAADFSDLWCEVREDGQIKSAFRTYLNCCSGSEGF
jgi:hypothetical protein